eukprot:CAMPEP_0206631310 /NCGR_PEP_ID=MMETSP0325_2-20121206/68126_1 /ASSEMBLY_ACC=CAM_ASM_000347 /TAXON_ID=2866 /ORGANISM="Crypthecodinium cohnii, Strain Seligo" /LENGTH=81 /DNA_ID=CAMNT_0054156403 /DNA_START=59 /DNA_END=301 /DNA_ORIENTATION=-
MPLVNHLPVAGGREGHLAEDFILLVDQAVDLPDHFLRDLCSVVETLLGHSLTFLDLPTAVDDQGALHDFAGKTICEAASVL